MTARSRSQRWGGAVAVLLAAAMVALAAGSAHAQTTTTSQKMVANTELEGLIPVAANLWISDRAQDFTTGSNSAGYTLTSVKISLTTVGDDIDPPSVTVVSGKAHADGGTELTGPSSLTADSTALYEYTAPDNTTLDSATQYWIVVEHDGDDVKLGMTDGYDQYLISADEDTALEGWSIGDYTWSRAEASTGEFLWGGRQDYNLDGTPCDCTVDPSEAYLIEVHGNPVGGV